MEKFLSPDYRRIFNDILEKKCPEKRDSCQSVLGKKELSVLDVIRLNELIFGRGNKDSFIMNQKHKSYNETAIIKILNYQKQNRLNNKQLSLHFNLSRNTVTKWRKMFKLV
ncbi:MULTISPECIES: transposase [Chryseobacterium]|uniref:transposase n=1 Tax=Chryseobacterium TaxID=59732 RepID=UPI000D133338|nr:transposase [Chryseobacterium aurantiacum]